MYVSEVHCNIQFFCNYSLIVNVLLESEKIRTYYTWFVRIHVLGSASFSTLCGATSSTGFTVAELTVHMLRSFQEITNSSINLYICCC